jgi:hypothetical protein
MKLGQYFASLMLGLVCLGLSAAIVVVSIANQRVQQRLNLRQAQLSSGILGAQGQQVRAAILQDMANAAAQNPKMRKLLERHGYTVNAGPSRVTATNAPSRAVQE